MDATSLATGTRAVRSMFGHRRRSRWWMRPLRVITRRAGRLNRALTSGLYQSLTEPVTVAAVITVFASALFMAAPAVDLAVSDAFHQSGAGFVAASDPVLRALRKSSSWIMGGLLLAVLASLVAGLVSRSGGGDPRKSLVRPSLCLFLVFVIGPGLLVNGVLKSLWGRARPVEVAQFGGGETFTPAWVISSACAANCSFTSGEGASAAWMAMVVMLVPARWRMVAAVPIVTYALMLSLNRVAFGGHFLSDVVLSWCLTGLVTAVAWRLMVTVPAAGRAYGTRRRLSGSGPVPQPS